MVVCLLCCLIPRRRSYLAILGIFGAYLTAILCVIDLTAFHYGNSSETSSDWAQWIYPMPFVLAAAAAVGVSRLFESRSLWLKLAVGAVLVYAVPLQVLRYSVVAAQTLANPTGRKDGSFDSSSLYQALSHIPVSTSLVVTNDISAPGRPTVMFNVILSGLLGHRFYLTSQSTSWDFQPHVANRFHDLQMLQQPVWTKEQDQLAATRGWTHFLVHKAAPHAGAIPYARLFENEDYAVYDLGAPEF
jgi:hypothetical protein